MKLCGECRRPKLSSAELQQQRSDRSNMKRQLAAAQDRVKQLQAQLQEDQSKREQNLVQANAVLKDKIAQFEADRLPNSSYMRLQRIEFAQQLRRVMKEKYFTVEYAAACKYGCKIGDEKWDFMRRSMFGTWVPNPDWPPQDHVRVCTLENPFGVSPHVPQGRWVQDCFPGTDIDFPMPPCSKTVGRWAKQKGLDQGLDTDEDGKACRCDFEKKMRGLLQQKPVEFWEEMIKAGNHIDVQIMAGR